MTPTDDRDARDVRAVTVDEDRTVVVEERPDHDEPVEVVRKRSFSIGQLLAMIAGAALVALGVAALVQTGVDTPLSEPVEPVLGWDHTPMLGIIEIAAGALLIVCEFDGYGEVTTDEASGGGDAGHGHRSHRHRERQSDGGNAETATRR